jgi:site-specific recombinase XerC
MIEDITARNLGHHSRRSHIYSCKLFAAFLKRSPDTATPDDIRRFQLHLVESRSQRRQSQFRVFHEARAAAGITNRVGLHSLRHSFATDLLEKEINIRYIHAL